ncbi:RbsD/FucU family protein [Aureimonas jatrophae]|jgi:L-fucose mutarotase|uniref:L-fucose mutarotase n=1 Tax=Aureimonas jatrophae TaxID=1166073 RepID=A0A1H0KLW8_9HYPH|nr:RbsD/FucU domain-containing protein [Aureimonas jatrophae]MBB3948773.1 L-fucose mutarotase [Aureimonas jatrophae]SDO56865.1 L-fucose mutarotase [Aureimonas jatrophae]
MLRHVHPLLGPDLLHALRSLGHGDEVVIADANFPSHSLGPRVVRLDGIDAVEAAEAILTHLPLDTFVDRAAFRMAVVDRPDEVPPITDLFADAIARLSGGDFPIEPIERFAFYERARRAQLIVATGERRLYGNLILTTGVLIGNSVPK